MNNIYNIDYWKNKFPNLNIHYMNRYLTFCKSIKNHENRDLDYIERHHIIPISIDKSYSKINDNIVKFSAREHYIAHWILMRAIGGKMVFAFHRLAYGKNNIKISSIAYEEIRKTMGKEISNMFKGIPKSEEAKKKMSKAKLNSKLSEETKIKISNSVRGFKHTSESKRKISKSNIGKHHGVKPGSSSANKISISNSNRINITNGVEEKHIKKEDLDYWLKNGWYKGTKPSIKKKNRITLNNGIKNIIINKNDIEKYLKEGYKIGSKIKGISKSEESKQKMSKSRKQWCSNNPEKVRQHMIEMNKKRNGGK